MRRTSAVAPPKHLAYHELLEQLPATGCVVCRQSAAAVGRYLDSLCSEFVNDIDLRERIRASFGFCAPHAARLDEGASRLTVAILYEDLLRRLDRELEASVRPPRRRPLPAPCPACEAAR